MAIRDFMNNYFYGKQGKADMTIADLPANRRELFGAVLKVRWSSLIGVNLLYLIIWIPAIMWTGLNLLTIQGMLTAEAGTYTREDLIGMVSSWLMLMIPCVAITGPCNAGATYVLRNWARDQHSFVLSDFWDALRGNWKQALPVSLISGLLPFLAFTALQFYGGMASVSPVFLLAGALVAMVALIWSMMTMVIYDMMVTYRLNLMDLIRNGFLLTIAKLPFALLFKLLTLAVPILGIVISELAPGISSYVWLVVGMLYLAYIPAFNKLMTVSYANWLCETYLNSRIEGAQTNIGLRPENWDDTEYRPEDDEA